MTKLLSTIKPLTWRQGMALLTCSSTTYEPFDNDAFIALIKKPYQKPLPTPEKICTDIAEQTVQQLTHSIIRSERQDRKAEWMKLDKVKSWSILHKRRLLSGKQRYEYQKLTLEEEYSFYYEKIKLSQAIFPEGSRGPEQQYDRYSLTVGIIIKFVHDYEWGELPRKLRMKGIDMRKTDKKKKNIQLVPSHQTFFKFYQQCDPRQLDKWLIQTDDWYQDEISNWRGAAIPLLYAFDGTGYSMYGEEVTSTIEKISFKKQHLHVTMLQNVNTRMIRAVSAPELDKLSRRDLRPFFSLLPKGTTLLAGAEFDVEYNYRASRDYDIHLHVRPVIREKTTPKSQFRRDAHEQFNKILYRKRKLEEGTFGAFIKRGTLTPRTTLKIGVWRSFHWAVNAYNYQLLLKLKISQKVFTWKTLPFIDNDRDEEISKIEKQTTYTYNADNLSYTSREEQLLAIFTLLDSITTPQQGLTSDEIARRVNLSVSMTLKNVTKLTEEKFLERSSIPAPSGRIAKHVYYLNKTAINDTFLDHTDESLLEVPGSSKPRLENSTKYQEIAIKLVKDKKFSQTRNYMAKMRKMIPFKQTSSSRKSTCKHYPKLSLLTLEQLASLLITLFTTVFREKIEVPGSALKQYFSGDNKLFKNRLKELEALGLLISRREETWWAGIKAEYWRLAKPP